MTKESKQPTTPEIEKGEATARRILAGVLFHGHLQGAIGNSVNESVIQEAEKEISKLILEAEARGAERAIKECIVAIKPDTKSLNNIIKFAKKTSGQPCECTKTCLCGRCADLMFGSAADRELYVLNQAKLKLTKLERKR